MLPRFRGSSVRNLPQTSESLPILQFCNKSTTASVIVSKGISPTKGQQPTQGERVIHSITHALPIVGGLIDSTVGIVTGAYYGIAGASHAVVSSVTGGRV
jgi:hypothetical protein